MKDDEIMTTSFERWTARVLWAVIGVVFIVALVFAIGCAGAGDKTTDALLVGGAAAVGAATGGTLWAGVMGGLASLWNWFTAPVVQTDPATWGFFAQYGFSLGAFIDRWAWWVGLALAVLLIVSARTRGLLWAWLCSIPKAIAAAIRRDIPAVKKQLALVYEAPAALTPFVGEPIELRMAREIKAERKRAEREADKQMLQVERGKIKRKGAET